MTNIAVATTSITATLSLDDFSNNALFGFTTAGWKLIRTIAAGTKVQSTARNIRVTTGKQETLVKLSIDGIAVLTTSWKAKTHDGYLSTVVGNSTASPMPRSKKPA